MNIEKSEIIDACIALGKLSGLVTDDAISSKEGLEKECKTLELLSESHNTCEYVASNVEGARFFLQSSIDGLLLAIVSQADKIAIGGVEYGN